MFFSSGISGLVLAIDNICSYELMEYFSLGDIRQDWRMVINQDEREDPYKWEHASFIHVLNKKKLVFRGHNLNDAPRNAWLNPKKYTYLKITLN